jgi:preprotein translocase subunit YajC
VLSHALPLALHVAAAGSSGKKSGSGLLSFLPLLVIVGIGYLLLVRPARNRQRRATENRAAVNPGVEVTTTAGLIATVVEVDDDTVTLEIAPGVNARFIKAAIARVNTPADPVEDIQPMHDDTLPSSGPDTTGDSTFREGGTPEPTRGETPPEPGATGGSGGS